MCVWVGVVLCGGRQGDGLLLRRGDNVDDVDDVVWVAREESSCSVWRQNISTQTYRHVACDYEVSPLPTLDHPLAHPIHSPTYPSPTLTHLSTRPHIHYQHSPTHPLAHLPAMVSSRVSPALVRNTVPGGGCRRSIVGGNAALNRSHAQSQNSLFTTVHNCGKWSGRMTRKRATQGCTEARRSFYYSSQIVNIANAFIMCSMIIIAVFFYVLKY